MKKLIAILICALLPFGFALAEAPQETPLPEITDNPTEQLYPRGDTTNVESISLVLEGVPVTLLFDDSPQYSSIADGLVNASFYAYSDDGTMLYELYIIFPDSARAGDTITPEHCASKGEESSVVLIASSMQTQDVLYFFSSVMGNSVYPDNSSYAIRIDGVDQRNGAVTYAGSLSADLIALNMATGEPESVLFVPEASFTFTIPEGDAETRVTAQPTPLPDDMRKV